MAHSAQQSPIAPLQGGAIEMLDGKVALYPGDCRDSIRMLADNSIDAVVTDPPYALVSIQKRFGKPGSAAVKVDNINASGDLKAAYARASAGFMGKQWDTGEVAFATEFWEQVFRVLKPGGHVVAFSGTRTYHRMTCAIEDAGFEIRDQLAWVYGSGFPKSHDVSKGIAKKRSEDIEPTRAVCRFIRAAMDGVGLKSKDLTHLFGDCNPRLVDHWAARDTDSQPALPTNDQWLGLVSALNLSAYDDFDFVAKEVARLNARKGTRGERWESAEIVGEVSSSPAGFGDTRFDGDRTIRDLDDEAKQWQGWGTALKPAWEPVCLARKPLIGTVAANVLDHGTGALNVDGCRVGDEPRATTRSSGVLISENGSMAGGNYARVAAGQKIGAWPANIAMDGSEQVLEAFGDSATMASRLFYSAKADANDRIGSKHPTVKPVDLMQWLCRLITPPGGTVLDPFAGTGTTGEAAWREGMRAVLIEREPEYQADIQERMRLAFAGPMERKQRIASRKAVVANDNDLFATTAANGGGSTMATSQSSMSAPLSGGVMAGKGGFGFRIREQREKGKS